MKNPMDAIDANKDGKISLDEVTQHFKTVDANGDGQITKEEIAEHIKKSLPQPKAPGEAGEAKPANPGAGAPARPDRAEIAGRMFDSMFERLDSDKNGKITQDEVKDNRFLPWDRLSQADSDKDGSISKEEMQAHMKNMAEQFRGRGGRPGPGGGPGGPPGAPGDIFKKLDANSDGKITEDELKDKPFPGWERLKNADADKDGGVTQAEMEEHMKKMREQFQHHRRRGPHGEEKKDDKKSDAATEPKQDATT